MKSSSRARRVRSSLTAVVVTVFATVSLSACSPDQVGAAAIVNGDVISTTSLQTNAREYEAIVPNSDPKTVQQRILEQMILTRVIAKTAREHNVHVSTGQVTTQLASFYAQTKGKTGLITALATQQPPRVIPPGYVEQWLTDQLLIRGIVVKLAGTDDPTSDAASARGSQALSATAKSMKIEVNPRYGTWDSNAGIAGLVSGGLSSTAAELNKTK
jgi:SurA N-terminal domain